jgi:hypothetical protein
LVDDTDADGVQFEGEVLQPRRLKPALIILGVLAAIVAELLTEPSTLLVVGAVVVGATLSVVSISLVPGATFVSIRPDALQVRILYRDAYYLWTYIGAISVYEYQVDDRLPKRWGIVRRIVWEYPGTGLGGRASQIPDLFGDSERLAGRLNDYRNLYVAVVPPHVHVVVRDDDPGV